MARIARQDKDAYRMLVGRHLGKSLKVAERVLGNRQDAEDVTQEVCLKIWDEAVRWEPRAKFSTWLYRVVINACLDRRRKAVPAAMEDLDLLADDAPGADEKMIADQLSDRVRRALQVLPERQRIAIVLGYYEELSNQEAADAMDIMLGAFQQLLFRAKQRLKDELISEEREYKHAGHL